MTANGAGNRAVFVWRLCQVIGKRAPAR